MKLTNEVNGCCDCATDTYPCIGDERSQLHKIYYRCDECGADELTEDEIHHVNDMDLCEHCYIEYEEELDRLDRCYECSGYGDDYSFDDDGELVSNCDDCPWNNSSADSLDD